MIMDYADHINWEIAVLSTVKVSTIIHRVILYIPSTPLPIQSTRRLVGSGVLLDVIVVIVLVLCVDVGVEVSGKVVIGSGNEKMYVNMTVIH